ncbi:MAG: endopeptidase La [Candidatus Dormibacteria bacterium]
MADTPSPEVIDDGAGDSGIETLPLVPLRDNVVFPHQMWGPLTAGRPRSVAALEQAVKGDNRVILAVQRNPENDDVELSDLHEVAVVANVGAFRKLQNGNAQALVEGQYRVSLETLENAGSAWMATATRVEETQQAGAEPEALVGSVKRLFEEYLRSGIPMAPEVAVAMGRATEPSLVADIASAASGLPLVERITLLQQPDPVERLRLLVMYLAKLVEVARLGAKINKDVEQTINKSQREAILREQLRATRKELAELEGGGDDEEDLAARVESAGMPETVKQRALKEVARLEQIPSASPELGIVRTWVDWLLDLPWADPPAEDLDIDRAAAILDEDHYGLPKVKDRLLEWLAVRQRARRKLAAADAERAAATASAVAADEAVAEADPDVEKPPPPAASDAPSGPAPTAEDVHPRRALQTPILCFVGPPGVGKTSLGRSIARALDRKFVRMSLGGIRDEAEIRGHRRTYIGAMPGRIIQSMRTAGTRNPVIMLDEIDKVGMDFRGDPSSALLEVLDPEQNREFSDHYLEVGYDLSEVLFITTANIVETVSPPLRDRMEIIRINGYTEEEKIGIAERHLIPKQLEQHGLERDELTITREALVAMLRGYTREAGVRQLDRTIAEIARKLPRKLAATGETSFTVRPEDLQEYLGPQRHDYGETQDTDEVGAVTGVVVSEVGGDIVTVEALAIEGRSDLLLTGQLGDVMEESARAALSWARVHGVEYGANKNFFDTHGLHIHVPAGAIPKDGPSAGVTITTAMVSAASGRPVRRDLAMTGEVTLRGRVLPIGGVKDKLLAAHRAGIKTFVLPQKNMRDLHEVDAEILEKVKIVPVDNVGEVLDLALLSPDRSRREKRGVGFAVPTAVTGTQH